MEEDLNLFENELFLPPTDAKTCCFTSDLCIFEMEGDLKKIVNGRQPHFWGEMEDNLN